MTDNKYDRNHVYQLTDAAPGSSANENGKAWLAANGIPAERTPMRAKFVIYDEKVQIGLFDQDTDGKRFLSVTGDFAKRDEFFDLVVTPDKFDVPTTDTGI